MRWGLQLAGHGPHTHTRCLSRTLSIHCTGEPSHLLKLRWWLQARRRCQAGPQHAFPKSLRPLCTRCTLGPTSLTCQQNTSHQRSRPSTALTPGPQTCCSWCLGSHSSGASAVCSSLLCQPPGRHNTLPVPQRHQQVRRPHCCCLLPWIESLQRAPRGLLPTAVATAAQPLLTAAETSDDTKQSCHQHDQNVTNGECSPDNSSSCLRSREPQWSAWGLPQLRTLESLWKQAAIDGLGSGARSAGQPGGPAVLELVFSVSGQDQARPPTRLMSAARASPPAVCQVSLLVSWLQGVPSIWTSLWLCTDDGSDPGGRWGGWGVGGGAVPRLASGVGICPWGHGD